MANYSVLKAAVQAVVKTNGNQEITGANMQSTLISIINSLGTGYQFMGVATPSTSPGTPDYNVAYIGGAGTYANFGTSVTVPVGSIGVFKYNGNWTKEQIALFAGIDDAPTAGSDNLVKSGGVYMFRGIPEALKNKTFLERNKRVNNYEIVVANGWSAQTMEVGNANTIFAKVSIPSTAVSAISFWDEQMQYIDGVLGDGKHEVSEYQCDVPVGAKYYIVCTYNDYLSQSEYYTDYEYFSLFNKIPYNCSSINDVEIQDKYSRVIAVMNGGHIRLKNFDSRNVDQESISNLRGKRISILGDSISSYQGYTPQGYKNFYFDARENWNGNVNDTYWKKAINELELVLGSNCSWSGSVCCGNGLDNVSAQSGCSDKRISDLGLGGTPDIILVYIGINDFASGYDLGDYSSNDDTPSNGLKKLYSEALSLTLGKIINSYPMARVFVGTLMPASTIKSTFPTGRQDGSGVYHTLSDWNSVIVDLASGYGCEVVDFSTCGITYGNLNSVTFEGLHPNVLGHSMMANKFIKTLITKF